MNSVAQFISTFDEGWLLLPPRTKTFLSRYVILYLCRGCDVFELVDQLAYALDWNGNRRRQFQQAFSESGFLHVNLKFYALAVLYGESVRISTYEVRKQDQSLLRGILNSADDVCVRIQRKIAQFRKEGKRLRSIEFFKRALTAAYPDLSIFGKKLVYKKQKFLMQTQAAADDVEGITADLLAFGFYSCYRMYPAIDSFAHLVNVAKRGMHNRCMNMINQGTTKSRNRLAKNSDGTFSALVVSIHATEFDSTFVAAGQHLGVGNALMTSIDGHSLESIRPQDSSSGLELKYDVRKVVEPLGKSAKLFASLLMGYYDDGFSAYLGQPNDEYYDKVSTSEYGEHVRRYLRVSRENARSLVLHLRKSLGAWNNAPVNQSAQLRSDA